MLTYIKVPLLGERISHAHEQVSLFPGNYTLNGEQYVMDQS